ncbi:MAG: hypothetical protein FWC87_05665, partial [Acidimicrobiaceae bacterium]|nr:hypothetical protein [Acidimicrobiaceae bacterium]
MAETVGPPAVSAPPAEPHAGQRATRRRGLAGRDQWLSLLRPAAVTMVAALGNFATALFLEHHAHLTANVVILAVALALSMGRVSNRHDHGHGAARWLALLVLPLVAVAANEIGTRMLAHPNLGDPLFVLAVTATIWVRRFGPVATRIATLATLPLVAMLIVPGPVMATGGSAGSARWWSALIAVAAVVWVRGVHLIAEQTGFLESESP